MEWLIALIGIVFAGILAVWLYIRRQGDCHFVFLTAERTRFVPKARGRSFIEYACEVPLINEGTQDGTIIDAFVRPLLPYEYFDGAEVEAKLTLKCKPREDGYWEAIIVPKGTGNTVIVSVKLRARDGDIDRLLPEMVEIPMDIIYQVVGRREWDLFKARLELTREEVRAAAIQAMSRTA